MPRKYPATMISDVCSLRRNRTYKRSSMMSNVFVSADRLLAIESGDRFHAISFSWDGYEPHFLVYSFHSHQLKEVELDSISFTVSDEQLCVGSFRAEGYRPCPFKRHVIGFDQCEFCSRSTIPIQKCLFDPICDGELCDWDLCKREHVVYIAFYGNKTKVGMTSSGRLTERLIEQGADAYFTVGTFHSRKAARTMEKTISSGLSIPQMHRSADLLQELKNGPDYTSITEIYHRIGDKIARQFTLTPSEIVLLQGYPIRQPLESLPAYSSLIGAHEGEVLGVKGRVLLYKNRDTIRALNMAAIPSRFMTLI